MRRILIIALVALVSLTAFAQDFQIGPTAMWNLPIVGTDIDNEALKQIGFDDFTFGADVRLRLMEIIEISGLALYSPEASYQDALSNTFNVPAKVSIYADGGIYLGLLDFIGLGIGLGPNFIIPISEDSAANPAQLGFNIKAHADLNLGGVGVSLNYVTFMPSLEKEAFEALKENIIGSLGVSFLFNF
jgi:hypothetical protein